MTSKGVVTTTHSIRRSWSDNCGARQGPCRKTQSPTYSGKGNTGHGTLLRAAAQNRGARHASTMINTPTANTGSPIPGIPVARRPTSESLASAENVVLTCGARFSGSASHHLAARTGTASSCGSTPPSRRSMSRPRSGSRRPSTYPRPSQLHANPVRHPRRNQRTYPAERTPARTRAHHRQLPLSPAGIRRKCTQRLPEIPPIPQRSRSTIR